MVRKIVRYPDPVLRAKCRNVGEITPEIRTLAADMLETMREANGVGLAAPQVAVDLQLAVIDVSHNPDCITFMKVNGEKVEMVKHMPIVLMNPQLELGSDKEIGEEGCLSFPRLRGRHPPLQQDQGQLHRPRRKNRHRRDRRAARPRLPARDRPPQRHPLHRPPQRRRQSQHQAQTRPADGGMGRGRLIPSRHRLLVIRRLVSQFEAYYLSRIAAA
jgi:peptide deformylase